MIENRNEEVDVFSYPTFVLFFLRRSFSSASFSSYIDH